jgi:hypothetical protein
MPARESKYRVLARIREGKGQPARRRRRWANNIKIHGIKIGYDRISVAEDRDQLHAAVVKTAMNR